jgi:hypothetical protein
VKRYKDTKYLVTEDGKVWSELSKRFLAGGDHDGYRTVYLGSLGSKYVHRLIAEVYLENPNNYKEINHINNDRSDNRAINLEWCTRQDNINHCIKQGRKVIGIDHPLAKATDEIVLNMRKLYDETNMSMREIGDIYGISKSVSRLIIKRLTWKHVP